MDKWSHGLNGSHMSCSGTVQPEEGETVLLLGTVT